MNKKKTKGLKVMANLILKVKQKSSSGYICIHIPKTLVGEEVKISFFRHLTDKEIELMKKDKLKYELSKIRNIREAE